MPGEYFIVSRKASVAVSTLASYGLSEAIAESSPKGLCSVGKTETENIGIDKIIRNTVTNPAIRFLIVAGNEPGGHHSGASLVALVKYGVDRERRIIKSPGKRPVLMNSAEGEIEIFRKQVEVVDMIGIEDKNEIISRITEFHARHMKPLVPDELKKPSYAPDIVMIAESRDNQVKLDKAGYFVILPECEKNDIIVEYYAYDNHLLKVIRGNNARDLYNAIIKNGWVSQLSHAAYLGKELEKAELSLRYGFRYVQDGT